MPYLIVFLILFSSDIKAQPEIFNESWRWAHFTNESGLPSNNVFDVIETPDSTLWAVCDAGIAWYDGYQWINVPIAESMLTNFSGQFSEYCHDSVFLKSISGTFIGGKSGFSKIHVSNSSQIQNVVYLSGDTILVHSNNSLYYFNNGTLQPLEDSQNIISGKVFKILRTRVGRVWIVTKEGIYRWEESKWRLIFRTNGELPFPPYITENIRGVALIHIELPLSLRGLWRWLPGRQIVQRLEGTAEGIRNIAIGPSGEIVAVYHSGEVRFYNGGSWSTSPILQSKTRHINNIFYRKNGDLVIATADGIHYFRASSSRWRVVRFGKPETWESVNEMIATRSSDIWFATGNGIVVESSNGTKKLITHIGNVPMVSVTGLAEDKDGSVWISSGGSFGGAYKWDGKRWKHFQIVEKSGDEIKFHKICKDRNGNLWFLGISRLAYLPEAQNPGAFMYDGKRFTHWGTAQGLLHGRVYAFAEDVEGALWFGTHMGISRWKDGKWKHWTKRQGLSTDHIFTLAVDKHNNVWFGHQVYGFGLGCIYSSGKVRYYTKSDGLINDFVWDVKVDSQDVVWISTEGGLSSYSNGIWSRFSENSGLHYNLLWPILPLEQEVYVGTRGQGVAVLDRQESATAPPRIVIDKPIIDHRNVHLGWRVFSNYGEISEDEILTRYRINNEGWSEWSKNRTLNLNNYLSGDHTIYVEARGLFRDYTGEGRSAAFNVPPPLYLHPFILSSAIFVFLGLITFTIVFIVRKKRHDSALRQREEKFRAVMETTSSAIFIYDRAHIHFMNSSAEVLTGYSSDETARISMNDMVVDEDRELFLKHYLPFENSEDHQHRSEIRIISKDAKIRWLDFTSGPIEHQNTEMLLGTAFDITERKTADEKLRSLTSELISTEERERHRIAIFLHDEIGHALALCKIKLRSLQKSNPQITDESDLREIFDLVDDSIKNTRSLTFDLSPPILYEMDFTPALQSLTEQLLEGHSIQLKFSSDDNSINLKNEIKVITYQMIRELVINTIKHARAHQVTLDLKVRNGILCITVADDGIGFKTANRIPGLQQGFGLFNIRERLSRLGGSMELCSNAGEGTRATISIPMIASTTDPQKEGT